MNTNSSTSTGQKPIVLVVVGPTAVGKTACSIALAQHFDGEIISADSRQFYKELNIGTAKPNETELSLAHHHFVNTLHVGENYTAGIFEQQGLAVIDEILTRNKIPIVIGGSGMYIDALIEGLDRGAHDPIKRAILNDLFEKDGLTALHHILESKDPEAYQRIDLNNPRRVIRAIEIADEQSTNRVGSQKTVRNFRPVYIGLTLPRETLYERINLRVDAMINAGLEAEAKELMKWQNEQALQTVGYKEWWSFFSGQRNRKETIEAIKQNSRRYAKRQLTWFRGKNQINWFNPTDIEHLIRFVEKEVY